ncbi:MAG TPA: GAF domain-containing protein, partial [Stellaceae bacterium]|nr:GAF domain-containing protein [Stellaceae bacterium]
NSSPGDLAPVFDAMLDKAMRLCEAAFGTLWTYDGTCVHAAALHNVPSVFAEFLTRAPHQVGPDSAHGRLLRGEPVVHIPDIVAEKAYQLGDPIRRALVELGGGRTLLAVPLRKDDAFLGDFVIYRQEARPFSDKQIALLQSFAAQAVIAMENVRLITELRQRTLDLQESLEYQTATSDVLKVISHSGAELRPVLETLVETATRICLADNGLIFQLQDGQYHMAASVGFPPEFNEHHLRNPTLPGRGTVTGRVAIERRVVHLEDAQTDPEYTAAKSQELGQTRTMLGVPLFRSDTVTGVITLSRSRVEPFSEKEIALVSTFADQAVIAIENARLFNELRARTAELGRSVEELKMLSEVGQAVSSTLDLRSVLSTILTSSLGLTWANAGAIFRYSRAERAFRLVEAVGWDDALTRSIGDLRLAETETAMGEAVARRMPVQLADTAQRASNPLRDLTLAAGFHSALIVPLVGAERILGALLLMRQEMGEFPPETVRLMQTLASQSVLAIQNARMFREIADKSEQLALASQHKSQFLANMSHELRTPLNAILGYAELLVDGIYGVLPDRPKGVLERIQNNGRHLLALINDVLDLAKIEAGQLTLTLEDYSLPEVVRSVVTATEPLATGKGLKFSAALQEDMPKGHGDARRLSQVLLNLVGNAIKFTDEGEVEIRGSADRGQFVLEVRDTGPGIPDADQDRIFGEFQQIDNSNTRQKGGTGLGLAISKRMVEMQGGTIAVESALGQGSTFRVVLPVHVDEMMEAA